MKSYRSIGKDKKIQYLIAFLIPVVICLMSLIVQGLYPFGTECFLKTDMYHQYAPFLSEFRRKLVSGDSLLYTWNVGLGVNFVALAAYYLTAVGNVLLFAVPEDMVIEFMTVLVVVKIGLSSVTMAKYLTAHFKKQDKGVILFSMFYALSGYICAYYWNLMWLDCIVLFPIVVLGLEKLVNGESGALYGITLAVTIFSNYYISMMTCIFAVIYFFVCNVNNTPKTAKEFLYRGIRFAFWSIVAGGCAAVLILPAFFTLQQSASASSQFPQSFNEYFSIFDMLARHLPAVETEQGLKHWPNIYCGTGAILFTVLYFRSDRITLKEKIVNGVLILLFLASFSVNVLNYIWHGLHYPNSLPARQSFIYIFLIICISYRAYLERDRIRKSDLGFAFVVSILFVLFCQKFAKDEYFSFAVYYLAIVLLSVYAGLLYISTRTRNTWLFSIALLIVVAELSINTSYTSMTTTSRESYLKNNDDIKELVDNLDDDGFYRIERVNGKTKNDGAWLGFRSVPTFSSSANSDCTNFFKEMGCEASVNAYSLNGATPLVDMLMGVKYSIYSSELYGDNYKEYLMELGETRMYKNPCTLPIGFMLPEGLSDGWMFDFDEPALVQNSICDELKVSQILRMQPDDGSKNGADYAVTIAKDGEYYAFITNSKVKSVDVQWTDIKKTFSNLDRRYFIDLGCLEKGDLIKIHSNTQNEDIDVELYRFDTDALRDAYEVLNACSLQVEAFDSDSIRGSVNVDLSQLFYDDETDTATLFLSIPYEKGWTMLVDGEPAATEKVFDTFLGVKLSAGQHSIELDFVPKGLKEGAIISLICLILLIAATMGESYLEKKKRIKALSSCSTKKREDNMPAKTADETDEVSWMCDDGCDADVIEYTREQYLKLAFGDEDDKKKIDQKTGGGIGGTNEAFGDFADEKHVDGKCEENTENAAGDKEFEYSEPGHDVADRETVSKDDSIEKKLYEKYGLEESDFYDNENGWMSFGSDDGLD